MKLTPVSVAFAVVTVNFDLCRMTLVAPAFTVAVPICDPLFAKAMSGVPATVVTSIVSESSLVQYVFTARTR